MPSLPRRALGASRQLLPQLRGAFRMGKLKKIFEVLPQRWKDLFSKEANIEILSRSNVFQYDEMGYPLRLCIVKEAGKVTQIWIDTVTLEGDTELNWKQ